VFTRYGFEAAAVTAFAVQASAMRGPDRIGIERTAILRFEHPYATIAIPDRPILLGERRFPDSPPSSAPFPQPRPAIAGVPLFTAWVSDPEEPEDDGATSARPLARSTTGP
jgi:hypothetical protein